MRSSTFSFNRADSDLRLGHVATAIAIGLLLLAAVEFRWRAHGAVNMYVDAKPRWSWVRAQADEDPGVVLLGASRIHFGFSLGAFRDRYPDTPVHQLAVAGQTPFAALRELAESDTFAGVAVVSFTPDIIMSFRRHEQQPFVDHYLDRWTIDVRLNFLAGSFAEKYLISRQYYYGIDSLVRDVISTGHLPPPQLHLETEFDREIHADYSMEDIAGHQRRRIAEATSLYDRLYPVSITAWRTELDDFLGYAKAIHDRGGCVVAVRFPSQGDLYVEEQRLFPKQEFWARLENVPYLATVHFDSLEIMDSVVMPDLQHVEKADKRRFTDALLAEMEQAVAGVDGEHCNLTR